MSIYTATNALVATTPRHIVAADGEHITSFRIAEQTDNPSQNNWFVVTVFGKMAKWASENVSKGKRFDISGHLRIRDWDNGETSGTSVEIEAARIAVPEHNCDCPNHKYNQ